MAKKNSEVIATSPTSNSAFFKQTYKRGLAIVGTSGIVFGLGVTSSTPGLANGVDECDGRTVTAASKTATEQFDAINSLLDTPGVICLSGDFSLTNSIFFGRDVHFKGIGDSSIKNSEDPLFISARDNDAVALYDITIEYLEIKESVNPVQALDVFVENSTFSDNTSGAIFAYGHVYAVNSLFVDNENQSDGGAINADTAEVYSSTFEGNHSENYGGAIHVDDESVEDTPSLFVSNSTFTQNSAEAYGGAVNGELVLIANSTFEVNSAFYGGAVASTGILAANSTFVDNSAEGLGAEGGAIFAAEGLITFSTFINNEAPALVEGEEDIPGDAIYRYGIPESQAFLLLANIFASSSDRAQLGTGRAPADSFGDMGSNLFSTSAATETDIEQDESSEFEATVLSIFGTESPELETHEPNANGTQTIAVSATGPAIDIVPAELFEQILGDFEEVNDSWPLDLDLAYDQRGGVRSNPADAGAFEYIAPATPTPTQPAALAKTGSDFPAFFTAAWFALMALGAIAISWASRLRRRNT
jgi:predicted outer membrane repeat protein